MASSATDVFISYKAEDRPRLKALVAALEAEGFSVWWDAHIGGGANWREDIQEHLDAAKCVIVAWSKRSVGREGNFVRDEATRAQRRGVYLPIRLDSVEPPLGFGEVQAIQFKGWKGDRTDERYRALLEAVRKCRSGEGPRYSGGLIHEPPHLSRRAAIAGGVGVAAAAAAVGWVFLKPARADAKRIAVLPFANMSSAPDQAYFAQGIAEELRGALSRIGLEVIGRASSEAVKDLDTKTAAEKLGVANILTGSVRRSPQMVRISAQLVEGSDGVERWAQSYDRAPGDEIKIQTDIATHVAQELTVALGAAGKAALKLGSTTDPAAHDLYLRARGQLYAANPEALHQALGLLDAAIARDSNYANAWQLKASVFERLANTGTVDLPATLAEGAAAAKQAIQIEPRMALGHVVLAQIEADRLNFPVALQSMRRGLSLAPNDIVVVSNSSGFMQWFGDPRKAVGLADRAVSLDPLKAINHQRRAEVLMSARRYEQSIAASRRALELDPKLSSPPTEIAFCLILMNRSGEAKAAYANVPPDDPFRLTGEAILAGRSRDFSAMEQILEGMRKRFGDSASFQYAEVYAQGRNADRAFAELNKALAVKDPGLQTLKTDPFLDPIRGDRRYSDLLQRLNFPTWA